MGPTVTAVDGAMLLKKLSAVGEARNAAVGRKIAVHSIDRPSEGNDCQDYADGTGSA